MQIDKKKVPVFHGEKDKNTLTIKAWWACIDAMKMSLNWSIKHAFCNATAALFHNEQRVVDYWAILDKINHAGTWTYLKKAMIKHWGDMKDSKSYMDGIRQRTDPFENPLSEAAQKKRFCLASGTLAFSIVRYNVRDVYKLQLQ